MGTMDGISLFDIAPDIEGIIVKELGVLLKFRECVKEFKGIVANPDSKSRYEKFVAEHKLHRWEEKVGRSSHIFSKWLRLPHADPSPVFCPPLMAGILFCRYGFAGMPLVERYVEMHSETCLQNAWCSLRKNYPNENYYQLTDIHGFKIGTWWGQPPGDAPGYGTNWRPTLSGFTHTELNAKLHELGATGYKSKRKDQKIKMLMSY